MKLRALITASLVVATLAMGAASAFAAPTSNDYSDYPRWAQHAFSPDGGG